jgi:hypothetical protein
MGAEGGKQMAIKTTTAPLTKKVTLNHGGKLIEVPVLSAPVGRPSSGLSTKYPNMNQPSDLATVDYCLSRLEAEVQHTLIKPNGDTLKELVDNGDSADNCWRSLHRASETRESTSSRVASIATPVAKSLCSRVRSKQ